MRLKAIIILSLTTFLSAGFAQSATLSVIVGAPPGGSADAAVRIVAAQLKEELQRTVIVENRPGADWMLAARYVNRRPPDGNTIMYLTSGPIIIPPSGPGVDTVDSLRDLTPLTLLGTVPFVVAVSPKFRDLGFTDFVAKAKANPGLIFFATSASSHQIAATILMQATGIKLSEVSYKGTGPMVSALAAGEVDLAFIDVGSVFPAIQRGDVLGLAVASAQRSTHVPNVPSATEVGYPSLRFESWGGFFAPPNMPEATVKVLHEGLARALNSELVKSRLIQLSFVPTPSTPEQLIERIGREREQISRVIGKAGAP